MRLIRPTQPEVLNIMAEWTLMESQLGASPLNGRRIMSVSLLKVNIQVNLKSSLILFDFYIFGIDIKVLPKRLTSFTTYMLTKAIELCLCRRK